MQDVMKLMYKAEDFMANDSWTYVKKVQTAGGIDMPLPSDHRPLVVDINF